MQRKQQLQVFQTLFVDDFKKQERNRKMFMTLFHLEKTKNWKRKRFWQREGCFVKISQEQTENKKKTRKSVWIDILEHFSNMMQDIKMNLKP